MRRAPRSRPRPIRSPCRSRLRLRCFRARSGSPIRKGPPFSQRILAAPSARSDRIGGSPMTATTTAGTGFDQFRASLQAELVARLPDHIERLRWSHQQIEAAQLEGLRALLAQATESSPFHRRRLGEINPRRFGLADLTNLPVMTKTDMMDALDDVFTDRRLNRGLVERALAATSTEPVPILGRYSALASGGVSGQRGVFVYHYEALAGFISSVLRSLMARLAALK